MNKPYKIGFIGLGLIGGSIARAIRQYYPDSEIIAFDKSREYVLLCRLWPLRGKNCPSSLNIVKVIKAF